MDEVKTNYTLYDIKLYKYYFECKIFLYLFLNTLDVIVFT